MNNYFLTTLSVIILLAFLDILISKKSSGKVVKSVISVIAVTMLAVPIVSIVKGNSSLTNGEVTDEYFNEYLINLEKKVVKNKINAALNNLEYEILNVELEFSGEYQELVLEKVKVIFCNSVINDNGGHIDILESVKKSLSDVVDVDEVEIVIETD